MTKITLGPDCDIDLDLLLEGRLLIQANSGGGKSMAIRRILEQSHAHVQHLVIDTEGEFASLRERFDYILAAPQGGDCAAHPSTAAILALKLLELRASAVIDVYELPPKQREAFVAEFLNALVRAPKHLWHPALVVIDEAQLYCPETARKSDLNTVTLAVIDLCARGRKRGLCAVLATNRLSVLSKDAAANINNRLIGRTSLDTDLKRAEAELGFSRGSQPPVPLRQLDPAKGEWYAYGPAISNDVRLVHVGTPATSHPKVGRKAKSFPKPPPPTEKIRALLPQLSDLPAQAEDLDPKVSKATIKKLTGDLAHAIAQINHKDQTILNLERQLADLPNSASMEQHIASAVAAAVAQNTAPLRAHIEHITLAMSEADKLIDDAHAILEQTLNTPLQEPAAPPLDREEPIRPNRFLTNLSEGFTPKCEPIIRPEPPTRRAPEASDGFTPNSGQKRILDALAWLHSIGITTPKNVQLGAIARIDTSGGHFSNLAGPLSSNGLIVRSAGTTALTGKGENYAEWPELPPSLAEYHLRFAKAISQIKAANGKTVEIFWLLVNTNAEPTTSAAIGEALGIDHTGGHFSNSIGPLSTLTLIKREKGNVIPNKNLLFPEGLR